MLARQSWTVFSSQDSSTGGANRDDLVPIRDVSCRLFVTCQRAAATWGVWTGLLRPASDGQARLICLVINFLGYVDRWLSICAGGKGIV